MPETEKDYTLGHYERYYTTYSVIAESPEEAIERYYEGECELIDRECIDGEAIEVIGCDEYVILEPPPPPPEPRKTWIQTWLDKEEANVEHT